MTNLIRLDIPSDYKGERLDKALVALLPEFSRVRLQGLIHDGRVMIDGAVVTQPSHKLGGGEALEIAVPPAQPLALAAEEIPLDIAYEDDALIVVNKPAGLVVHPAPGHHGGTLVNALLGHCRDSLSGIGGVERPGIVHRLDKDTSGLLVVAKSDAAHQGLAALFASHDIDRAYQALVWGRPTPLVGRIEKPLGRHGGDRMKMAVVAADAPGGRHAATRYRVEQSFGAVTKPLASLVTCTLETGRTHQIRVHMASIGHPVIGDPIYGGGRQLRINGRDGFPRQALHAARLGFLHPITGEPLTFEAPLPNDIKALLDDLAAL